MDFPPYYLDHLAGGRLIIGLIASIHVLINHPLAVGAYPMLCYMEWWAHKNNRPDIDRLAYKITAIVFVVTTTVGAMTGVGIWLSTSLFSPFAIGSLLRVFFFGWFAEWLVFISEVCLIMWWFLSWKKANTPEKKRRHIKIGLALAIMSWLTMALIVAVLGFMMNPGDWSQTRAFIDAMTAPLYVPQLAFRTAFAFMTGAVFLWFAAFFFTKGKPDTRAWIVERMSHTTLISLFFVFLFGTWYWNQVPEAMKAHSAVALLSQSFSGWHEKFKTILAWTLVAFAIIGCGGIAFTRLIPRWALLIPTFMGIWLLGHFERTREFLRKPWVLADYMYSNGVRKEELSFLQSEGMLKHAAFVAHREVTPENRVEAGRDVFMISCSRCHSTTGINGVIEKFTAMYGDKRWDDTAMVSFLGTMHQTSTFMPPFPGTTAEKEALVAYIQQLRDTRQPLQGAQTVGIRFPARSETSESVDLAPALQPVKRDEGLLSEGKAVYSQFCIACHQPTGLGVPGAFPPLKDSDWVKAEDPAHLIRLVLHGLSGPIHVNGQPYNGMMPPQGTTLDDRRVAAVLSHIREEWGDGAGMVTTEEVEAVRKAEAGRVTPWTMEELRHIPAGEPSSSN